MAETAHYFTEQIAKAPVDEYFRTRVPARLSKPDPGSDVMSGGLRPIVVERAVR